MSHSLTIRSGLVLLYLALACTGARGQAGAPVIVTNPSNRVAALGSSVTFSVNATGASPLAFRWLKDGLPIPDRTNRLILLTELTATDAGIYAAVVFNPIGSVTSQPASLTLTGAPPSAYVPATNVLLCAGGAAIYAVGSGSPPLHYQWRYHGADLPGQNTNSILVPADPAKAGDYTLVMTNHYGALTSAVVVVELGPRIISQPGSGTVPAGSTLTLRVIAEACRPRHQWRFNGSDLLNETNYQLHLPPLTPVHAGDYTVVVSDVFRSITSTVSRIEVEGRPPEIIREPADVIDFYWGTNAIMFSVGFTAAPAPRFQWQFDGMDLPGQTNATLSILPSPDRQGGYSVILSNYSGVVTSRVALFRYLPEALVPSILSYGQPVGQALCPDANEVLLHVTTENPPTVPLFFQWRRNAVNLPDATNRGLALAGTPADVGDYTVVVTNTYGAVTSEVARVAFTPVIVNHPDDALDVPDGHTAQFYAVADSCIPFEWQWQHNGVNLVGATNALLIVSRATLATAGDYRAVARNAYGAVTSRVARLEVVQTPPDIVADYPFDLEVEAGQEAYFDVAYFAAPPPAFQWRFNGINIPGETNEFLQFPAISTNQNGGYSVVLSNVAGVVTSRVAQLTVIIMPPEISPESPEDMEVGLGDYASFYVAHQALPPAAFQWRHNGMDLPGETNELLYFMVSSTNQAGGYSVVLSNAHGMATSRVAQLTIFLTPPEITFEPLDLTVQAGNSVNFSVGARGSPPPTFQWRLNGANIPGATNQYWGFTAGFTNQEGGYSVVVSNEFGAVTSRVAMLDIILVEPSFTTQPINRIVLPGADTYFLANLNVPAYWQWQFNNLDLPGATNRYYLNLFKVDTDDAGEYRVIAWNDAGRTTSEVATLTVRMPDALDHWRWRRPSAQGNSLYSVALNGSQYVAVGDTGALVTSTNSVNWVDGHQLADTTSRDTLVAGNGILLTINANHLEMSVDGINWVEVGPEETFTPQVVAFGAGRFVATGYAFDNSSGDYLNTTAISTNGRDWQLHPSTIPYAFAALSYVGGRFLASAHEWRNGSTVTLLFTSSDGETWTPIPGELDGYFYKFAYGSGTYAGVSYSPGNNAAVSPDGTNWTLHPIQLPPFIAYNIAYGAGRFVTVSFPNGLPALATSTNGLNWSVIPDVATNGLWGIIFAADRFMAVGRYGVVITSADGLNWTKVAGGSSRNFRDITRAGGLNIAVGNDGMLLTSLDGSSWISRDSGTSNNLRAVTFFRSLFLIVGEQDQLGGTVLSSSDGTSWMRSTAPGNLFGLAHNGHRLVAVGDNGVVVTSLDGVTWSNVFSSSRPNPAGNRDLNAITWGGGRFVAVGRDGRVIVSTNGLDWAATSFPSPNLHGVAYGNGLYVTVARNGGVAYSTNATNWQSFLLNNADGFSDVTFGGGQFMAVGDDGMMFTTTNGSHWIPRITSCEHDLRAAVYAEGSFYLAGDNETILQSFPTAAALRVAWLPAPPYGRLRIEMLCEPGRAYRLQRSDDLAHWTDLHGFTATREATYFMQRLDGPARPAFYRLVNP